MNDLTKLVLKRPVSALLIILSLLFFGSVCFSLFSYELTPDISMPMYIVVTVYPGASPEDCDKNICKKYEEQFGNLADTKEIDSIASENYSAVIVQYNYGTDMSKAYDELKKVVDRVANDFDDAVQDPMIIEMDMNSMPSLRMVVENEREKDLYNYVTNEFVPQMEKLSAASEVRTSGGRENYVSISIRKEEAKKYKLTMDTLASIVKAADFTYPAGKIDVADRSLSVSTQVEYETVESFKKIPIVTGNGNTIYLEDIADVSYSKKEADNIGRYNKKDTMIVSILKKQSSTAVELSKEVKETINKLKKNDPALSVTIVEDSSENILAALKNVFQTMITAIVLSMIVILLFFGDLKASLIVGTSIPISILTALISMYLCGFSLNLITLSALVLGVGMMVDNSIVVLEACFRAQEELAKSGGREDIVLYVKTTLLSTKYVGASILGGTLTTVVVFAPLAFLKGMAGQFFTPLGLTIVFCMLASLISALTIVPLCYVFLHPKEKEKAPLTKFLAWIQKSYREFIPKTIKMRWGVLGIFVALAVLVFSLGPALRTELVPQADEGKIKITITTKPSLLLEDKNEVFKEVEEYVSNDENVDNYLIASDAGKSYSNSSADDMTLIAYLKENRKMKTKQIVSKWNKELAGITNCTLTIDSYSTSFTAAFSTDTSTYTVVLSSSNYDKLKEIDSKVLSSMRERKELIGVHSTLENNAPLVKISVDPILAAAEGLAPAQIGQQVYACLSGNDLMDKTIDGETLNFKLEYPKEEYEKVTDIENIILTAASGKSVLLKDVATITFADSPKSISKIDKNYRATITAKYATGAGQSINKTILEECVKPNLTQDVTLAQQSYDKMLDEEIKGLIYAIITAIFLVFVVMAMQFESLKFSFMVMSTVLFSFVGSVFALWITDVSLSIPALLGVMMLIGTAVNNGILYVDTVNQLRDKMSIKEALVEAGAIRYRPILMTTLTTIIAEIPMACAYGRSGEILQGLALVNFGGLVTSTITALYLLPSLYLIFYGKEKKTFYTGMTKSVDTAFYEVKEMTSSAVY